MTDTGIDTAGVDDLVARLSGTVVRPGDPGYDEARALYNAMHDKRPALIVRAAGVDDVVAAVNYGREHGLEIAVRGGGHNGAGLASVDDGLVIDLSRMNGVEVTPPTAPPTSRAARSSPTSTPPRTSTASRHPAGSSPPRAPAG